jgi:hypothetical protein
MQLARFPLPFLGFSLGHTLAICAVWITFNPVNLVPARPGSAISLPPQQDVYIDVNSPTTNFETGGSAERLLVASSCLSTARNPSQVSYIQFAGFDPTASSFTITLATMAQDVSDVPIFLIPVPNTGTGFDESTLTWSNQREQTGFAADGQSTDDLQTRAVATATPSGIGTTVTFTGSALDQVFRNGGGSTTFAIVASCDNVALVADFAFGSKENPAPDLWPALTIQ